MAAADIPSDDRETARVIGIHDGARDVGYIDATTDIAGLVAKLARRKAASGTPSDGYATALNDVLLGIQELQAEKRKA